MRNAIAMVVAMVAMTSMQANAAELSEAASAVEIVVVTKDQDERVRETTVWVAVLDGSAFVRTSGTPWGRNVDRDPHMVLKIGSADYPASAERVQDEVLVARVQAAFRQKYGLADRAARFVRFLLGGSRIYRVTAR